MRKFHMCAAAAVGVALTSSAALGQTPIPPSPQDFVMAASQSDAYEILAADIAETQSQDPRVQAFAKEMIDAHTRTSAALRQAASAAGLRQPDPGMSSDQAALLGSLQGLRGTAFDKAYAKQQVLAHTQALAVQESFAASGADPRVRDAATAAVPIIRDHLRMAEKLRSDLGPL